MRFSASLTALGLTALIALPAFGHRGSTSPVKDKEVEGAPNYNQRKPFCSAGYQLSYLGKDLRFDVAEQIGSDVATKALAAFNDENRVNFRITHFINPKAAGFKNQFSVIQMYRGNTPVPGAWDVSYISSGTTHEDGGGPTKTGWYTINELDKYHVSASYPKRGNDNDGGAPMLWSMELTSSGVFMHSRRVTGVPASHGCVGLQAPDAGNEVPYGRMKKADWNRIKEQASAHQSELSKSYMFYSIVEHLGKDNGLVNVVDDDADFDPAFLNEIKERLMNPKPNSQVADSFGIPDFKTNGKFYVNPGTEDKVKAGTYADGNYSPDTGSYSRPAASDTTQTLPPELATNDDDGRDKPGKKKRFNLLNIFSRGR